MGAMGAQSPVYRPTNLIVKIKICLAQTGASATLRLYARRRSRRRRTIAVTEVNHMETAIGVFTSRDHAEMAVKQLRERGVSEESIVFLTRSESEAKSIGKELGAYVGSFVGGAAGMTGRIMAVSLLFSRLGTVFPLW